MKYLETSQESLIKKDAVGRITGNVASVVMEFGVDLDLKIN